jgi:hypothetical protein
VADSFTPRCLWDNCGKTSGLRLFAAGYRCRDHSPSALAATPEPELLHAQGLIRLAEIRAERGAV